MFKFLVHIAIPFHRFHLKHTEWAPIEAGAFAGTYLYLVAIPGSISFIARDAFLHHCAVTSAKANSDAEFSEWNLRRPCGASNAFERKPLGRGESTLKKPR
jgi:hypothetical protein